MARLAVTISYDGMHFAGSQIQRGVRTVQGELDEAMARLFNEPVVTTFAGRTDRGVHAAGQVVSCRDARPAWAEARLVSGLNAVLPTDISVGAVERRSDAFHARYDARWREYRYRLWTGSRQPLVRDVTWQRRGAVDIAAMVEAAGRLSGTRDFAAATGGGRGTPWAAGDQGPRGTVRTLARFDVYEVSPWWMATETAQGKLIEFRAVADGFLPRMVRNLVSMAVEVGRGARSPAWIDQVLATRDRRAGPQTAPARGLTLWRVDYAI